MSAPLLSDGGRPAYWLQRAPAASPFGSPLRGAAAANGAGGVGGDGQRIYGLRSASHALGAEAAEEYGFGFGFGSGAAGLAGAAGARKRAHGGGGADEGGGGGGGGGGGYREAAGGRRVAPRFAAGGGPPSGEPPAEGEDEADSEARPSYDEVRDRRRALKGRSDVGSAANSALAARRPVNARSSDPSRLPSADHRRHEPRGDAAVQHARPPRGPARGPPAKGPPSGTGGHPGRPSVSQPSA